MSEHRADPAGGTTWDHIPDLEAEAGRVRIERTWDQQILLADLI